MRAMDTGEVIEMGVTVDDVEDDFVDAVEEVVVSIACGVALKTDDGEVVPRIGLGEHVLAVSYVIIFKRIFESCMDRRNVEVI